MSVSGGAVCHMAHVVPIEFVFIQVFSISIIKSHASNSETSWHWQWMPVICVFMAVFRGYFWYSIVLIFFRSVLKDRNRILVGLIGVTSQVHAPPSPEYKLKSFSPLWCPQWGEADSGLIHVWPHRGWNPGGALQQPSKAGECRCWEQEWGGVSTLWELALHSGFQEGAWFLSSSAASSHPGMHWN